MQAISADLTYIDGAFQPDITLHIERGMIVRIESGPPCDSTTRLARRALLPGFVNVHSHAFQRALRGAGETFPDGAGSFWTWRVAMYQLVETLDPELVYDISLQAFREMRAAGITTVGEFHYVRHDASRAGYALDEAVVRAAADAPIRLALLPVYYKTSAPGKPPEPAQARFCSTDLKTYWNQFDRLASMLDSRSQTLGVVAHSIRAVSIDDIKLLCAEARTRKLPFHMHVEEQPREIAESMAAYGKRPTELLLAHDLIDNNFTAIHCTYTDNCDMTAFGAAGGRVCICTLSEANLADGIADISAMRAAGATICLGTDSNARIDFTEETRWLEYVQRLNTTRRGVILDHQRSNAVPLLECATRSGADALAVNAGSIEVGAFADFVELDLDHPSLAGATPESLAPAFILGAGQNAISRSILAGAL